MNVFNTKNVRFSGGKRPISSVPNHDQGPETERRRLDPQINEKPEPEPEKIGIFGGYEKPCERILW